jgi:hypothetical protein
VETMDTFCRRETLESTQMLRSSQIDSSHLRQYVYLFSYHVIVVNKTPRSC